MWRSLCRLSSPVVSGYGGFSLYFCGESPGSACHWRVFTHLLSLGCVKTHRGARAQLSRIHFQRLSVIILLTDFRALLTIATTRPSLLIFELSSIFIRLVLQNVIQQLHQRHSEQLKMEKGGPDL